MLSIVLLVVFDVVQERIEDRNRKKKQVEEFFRREHMSSEERVAEDAKNLENAKIAAKNAALTAVKSVGKTACLAAWRSSLHDPDAGVLTDYSDSTELTDYYAMISGRAKNAFNAYRHGSWTCHVEFVGGKIDKISLRQQ